MQKSLSMKRIKQIHAMYLAKVGMFSTDQELSAVSNFIRFLDEYKNEDLSFLGTEQKTSK